MIPVIYFEKVRPS